MEKRVGLLTEKARKVDLIYFAGFKCALEDCYKHQHIDIHSRFVLKIGYGLELLAPLQLLYGLRPVRFRPEVNKPRKGIYNLSNFFLQNYLERNSID